MTRGALLALLALLGKIVSASLLKLIMSAWNVSKFEEKQSVPSARTRAVVSPRSTLEYLLVVLCRISS